ncbi:MAG: ThuA domain-containing protein [Balneolales bacterium]
MTLVSANRKVRFYLIFMLAPYLILSTIVTAQDKQVLFIAGDPSHGFGNHEHYGGSELLARTINEADIGVHAEVVSGWPENENAFDHIDAVVIYVTGGERHPILNHLESFQQVMDRGVGLVTLHYGVEVPKGEPGDKFLEWQGGYFETDWSVNPHWTINITDFPNHSITRGVEPFEINDEWYYHMRFADGNVIPILSDLPPKESLSRKDGPHSNNKFVRDAVLKRGESQHVAWAYERSNGGKAFGFTGGHYHWNWANDSVRRLVANAIVWAAGAEVPEEGIAFEPITVLELSKLTDDPVPEGWDHQSIQDEIDASQ